MKYLCSINLWMGGRNFGSDIFIASQPGGWNFDIPGIQRCNGFPITLCDISYSPYRGHIYVVWSDQRNGPGNTDVFIIKSIDKGKTWGEVIKVNSDTKNRHQFFPWASIDPSNGNIHIVFYDRRETRENVTDVYMASSIDGGNTFKNYKISESSFIPDEEIFFGDYINITAHGGKAYPIWTRMDSSQLSVWTTVIGDSINVSVKNRTQLPEKFELKQNFPNPFNPSTTITYELSNKSGVPAGPDRPPANMFVNLIIYDILGNTISTLVNELQKPGKYEVVFNADGLSSGVYFYRLIAGSFSRTKKLILLR